MLRLEAACAARCENDQQFATAAFPLSNYNCTDMFHQFLSNHCVRNNVASRVDVIGPNPPKKHLKKQ